MKQEVLVFDTETRSASDLKRVGAHRYFQDSTTEVLCLAWALGDGPIQTWRKGQSFPSELFEYVKDGKPLCGHNVSFDRLAWRKLGKQLGMRDWPDIPEWQVTDTMARAQALGLPAGLAKLGEVLKIEMPKDMDGHALMMRMCKPRAVGPDGQLLWWESDSELDALVEYCARDIGATREIHRRLPDLSDAEREIYRLDQKINARGVRMDIALADKAHEVAQEVLQRANERMYALTNGAVKKTSEVAKIKTWLQGRHIPCTTLGKGAEEELILCTDVMDDDVAAEVILLRMGFSKTSTAKYKTMQDYANADGRIRGCLHYHAAYTGRWASRGFQFHNFPRWTEDDVAGVRTLLDLLPDHEPEDIIDAFDMMEMDLMGALSCALRSMIIPGEGKQLVGGDFKNIEGRIAAWLAGETWKVKAYEAFDAGSGPDLYLVTAGKILGKPSDAVTKAERQSHGKVPELALGYQGGKRAFQKMGALLGVHVSDERADEIKQMWRDEHPGFTKAWRDLQDAAWSAVKSPGLLVSALNDKVRFKMMGGMLYMRLPSGRAITYPQAEIREMPRVDYDTGEVIKDENGFIQWEQTLTCMHMKAGRWQRVHLYGGMFFANVVSGAARDILCEAMMRIDPVHPIILTVHDEIVSEMPDWYADFVSAYKETMEVRPEWGKGIPITADVWTGARYAK